MIVNHLPRASEHSGTQALALLNQFGCGLSGAGARGVLKGKATRGTIDCAIDASSASKSLRPIVELGPGLHLTEERLRLPVLADRDVELLLRLVRKPWRRHWPDHHTVAHRRELVGRKEQRSAEFGHVASSGTPAILARSRDLTDATSSIESHRHSRLERFKDGLTNARVFPIDIETDLTTKFRHHGLSRRKLES
jgi:hypothetical protein